MAKKKFIVNRAIDSGLHKAAEHTKKESGKYENELLPISEVESDNSNPRHLSIKPGDIKRILQSSNIQLPILDYEQLNQTCELILKKLNTDNVSNKKLRSELESLAELAHSVMTQGLIHPILVYTNQGKKIIVAGERRYLSHLLLGRDSIEARVYLEKPSGLVVKVAQWAENIEREDLTPYAKVQNVQQIIDEIKNNNNSEDLSTTKLSEISSLPKSSASYYLRAAKAPQDVLAALNEGIIPSVRKAAMIAGEEDVQTRKKLIAACANGVSESDLGLLSSSVNNKGINKNKVNRKAKKVYLGSITDLQVAKKLIEAVVCGADLHDVMLEIDWNSHKAVSDLFHRIINKFTETG